MGQVALPVLAKVGAVGVDDGRGVVVEAGHVLLVDRNDHDHAMLASDRLHERDGRTLGNVLDHGVPPDTLLGREVRPVEQLLETHDLDVPTGRLLDQRDVLVDEPLLQVVERRRRVLAHRSLDEPSPHDARHRVPPWSRVPPMGRSTLASLSRHVKRATSITFVGRVLWYGALGP